MHPLQNTETGSLTVLVLWRLNSSLCINKPSFTLFCPLVNLKMINSRGRYCYNFHSSYFNWKIVTLFVRFNLWPKGRKINLSLNYRNYSRINYKTHFLFRLAFGEISLESVDICIAFGKCSAEQLLLQMADGNCSVPYKSSVSRKNILNSFLKNYIWNYFKLDINIETFTWVFERYPSCQPDLKHCYIIIWARNHF